MAGKPAQERGSTRSRHEMYLNRSELADLLGIAPDSITRYRNRDPGFPKPDRWQEGRPAWKAATIEAWLASRPGPGATRGRPPNIYRNRK